MDGTPDFTVERSIEIGTSAESLWDLLNDDDRIFEVQLGLVEHRVLETHAGGGHDCVQVYELADGRRFVQTVHITHYNRPICMMGEATHDEGCTAVTTTLAAAGATSTLTIRLETTLNDRAGPLRRRRLRRASGRTLLSSLNHIKVVAERTPAP